MRKCSKLILCLLTAILVLQLAACSGDGFRGRRINFGFEKAEKILISYNDERILIEDPASVKLFSEEFSRHKYAKITESYTGSTPSLHADYYIQWLDSQGSVLRHVAVADDGYTIGIAQGRYRVGADQSIDIGQLLRNSVIYDGPVIYTAEDLYEYWQTQAIEQRDADDSVSGYIAYSFPYPESINSVRYDSDAWSAQSGIDVCIFSYVKGHRIEAEAELAPIIKKDSYKLQEGGRYSISDLAEVLRAVEGIRASDEYADLLIGASIDIDANQVLCVLDTDTEAGKDVMKNLKAEFGDRIRFTRPSDDPTASSY